MNKKFRRLTNTVLALVLSLGMVFGMFPGSVVHADEPVASASVEPTVSLDLSDSDTKEGYEFETSEDGSLKITYTKGYWYRLRFNVSNSDITKYDKLVIDLTPSDPMHLGIVAASKDGTETRIRNHDDKKKLSADEQKLEFQLQDDISSLYFYVDPFWEEDGGTKKSFTINSIKLLDSSASSADPEPEQPVQNGPKFTATTTEGCSYENNSDGSIKVSYKKGSWNRLDFDVTGSDISKYNKLVIDVTTEDAIVLGTRVIAEDGEIKLRDHWGNEKLSVGKTVFEYDLTKDITGLYFWIDPKVWADDAPENAEYGAEKVLTINNIKLVDSSVGGSETETTPSVSVNLGETSSAYNPEVQADGSVKFSYNHDAASIAANGGWWSTVILDVKNCDISKYNQLRLDITPAGDDMTLGFYDKDDHTIKGHATLPKSGRQVVKVDLTANQEKIRIYCDANLAALGNREFTIHKVWLCDKDDPDFLLVDKANFTTIEIDGAPTYGTVKESQEGGFGTVTPPGPNGTVKIKTNFNGYTYKAGDVYVLYFDGIDNMAGGQFQMGWDLNLKDAQVNGNMLYITLPETDIFSGETTSFVRYKGASNAVGDDIHLKGAHIYDGEQFAEYLKSLSAEEEEETRSAKINIAASSGYNITKNEDGSYSIKYNRKSGADCWDTVKVDITNDDWEQYNQLRVEMTPATAMTMAVLPDKNDADGHNIWFRSHVGFDTEDRQIVKINLTKDQKGNVVIPPIDRVLFYCDSEADHNTQVVGDKESLDRELVVYKLWLCNANDPDFMPTDKVKFTDFAGSSQSTITDVEEGGFGKVSYTTEQEPRIFANFEGVDGEYKYTEGDVFAFEFEGIDDIKDAFSQVLIGYGLSSGEYIDLSSVGTAGSYAYYKLPEDKAGNFAAKQPTYIRFKAKKPAEDTILTFKGMHIYDGAEWKKFVSSFTYNEDDCPQGLSISYYSDIYSRGFAWVTRDHIDEQYIEYIKATDGMTKEDVDWDSADVQRLDATRGEDRVDTKDITWHLYKAHLENLEKNTTYFFRAGNKDFGFYDTGSFTIEDDAEKINKVTFLHLTDCQEDEQSSYTKWAKVLEAGFKTAPDSKFVAFTGDLINDYHGRNMLQWNWGLAEPKKSLLDSVIMPTAGNHDEWEYAFTDRFDIKWADYIKEGDKHPITGKIITDGTLDEKTGGCYSFMYGEDVAFINLNTNDTNNLPDDFQSQYDWLEGELKKYENVKWKIVQVHKGLMSAGNHTNDGEVDQLRDLLPPLFAKYKVDLVLQGHDHVYTRSRSYLYGKDFDGKYYDGHTPSWLNNKVMYDQEFNGHMRELTNLEPQGTHYVTINYCASKSYPVEPMDKVIYPGVNPIEGNGTAIQLKGQPMFGVVSIEGDALTYDAYTYNPTSKEVKLYDTFSVAKSADVDEDWNRGYRDRHEGMNEVTVQNIAIDSKPYDGKPVKLNLRGFVSSEPSLIDYSKLQFDIEGDNGFKSTEKLPTEKGNYTATVSIETIIETGKGTLMYYNDSTVIHFSIY
ncbi:MAG: metallophosphoesterase family protein [Lachnospiraceae bacterium]|nr:metallophosphoesterase family protein [Lachnospiraceae bacterium]